jgi:hypothetical protein
MSDPTATPTRPGCLTEDEVIQVRAAAPGQVPDRLARHLASCARCQERALFGSEPRRRRARPRTSTLPTPTRALVLLVIMIVVIMAFFYTLSQLVGDPSR